MVWSVMPVRILTGSRVLSGRKFPDHGNVYSRSVRLLRTVRSAATLRTLAASPALLAVGPGIPGSLIACGLGARRLS